MPIWIACASLTCLLAAYSRTSCVIFIEQKCGPHMLQKCETFAALSGRVFIVKVFGRIGVQREIELVFPAELEPRF